MDELKKETDNEAFRTLLKLGNAILEWKKDRNLENLLIKLDTIISNQSRDKIDITAREPESSSKEENLLPKKGKLQPN